MEILTCTCHECDKRRVELSLGKEPLLRKQLNEPEDEVVLVFAGELLHDIPPMHPYRFRTDKECLSDFVGALSLGKKVGNLYFS